MAINSDYLSQVGGGGNAPRIWTYKTEDTIATVDGADYFVEDGIAVRNFELGDVIFVSVVTNIGASNEALADHGYVVVNSVSTTSVDTTNETASTTTDSD